MSNKIYEIKKQIEQLENALKSETNKKKTRKGTTKQGDWTILRVYSYDDNDKLVEEEGPPIVFYHSPTGNVCMNAYLEWYSEFIVDLTDQAPYDEKWKATKVNKEEAIKYL